MNTTSTYVNTLGGSGTKFFLTPETVKNILYSRLGTVYRIPRKAITIERSVLILDTSFYQGQIDYAKLMETKLVSGMILRAGQAGYEDSRFRTNSEGARLVGLPQGSYFFYDSREDPFVQAARWWTAVKTYKGELPHFLDIEENYGGKYKGWQNWKLCIKEFLRLSGLPVERVGIYTAYWYWMTYAPITNSTELTWFKQFTLWLAWYTANPANVIIPRPWTIEDLWGWQYGTTSPDGTPRGELFGMQSKEVDESNFNGDLAKFISRHNLSEPVPDPGNNSDPNTGDTNMSTQTIVVGICTTQSLIVRDAPSGNDTGKRVVLGEYVLHKGKKIVSGSYSWIELLTGGFVAVNWISDLESFEVPVVPTSLEPITVSLNISGYPALQQTLDPLTQA